MDRDLREILRRLEALERDHRSEEPWRHDRHPRPEDDRSLRDDRGRHDRPHPEHRRHDAPAHDRAPAGDRDRPGQFDRDHPPRWDDAGRHPRHEDARHADHPHSPRHEGPPPPPPRHEPPAHQDEPGEEERKFAELVARIVTDRVRDLVRSELDRRFGPRRDGPPGADEPQAGHGPQGRRDDHSDRH